SVYRVTAGEYRLFTKSVTKFYALRFFLWPSAEMMRFTHVLLGFVVAIAGMLGLRVAVLFSR
ncbi:MAG: hypothetical protein QXI12_11615, partial [Candidatus Methanomethyliaceae archaeon]